MKKHLLIFILSFLILSYKISAQNENREFRGVWVATVANIDWPSKPGLSSNQQMQEAIEILDMHKSNGMNAIILQIRPASDAFYPSEFEPWSQYLTGIPGQAPSPYYDPLQFWIEETHKRGMEFHAWCNPYRVSQNKDKPLAGNHIAFEHPEWIVEYGNKLYFNPGLKGVRQFVTSVVEDIVNRYDVDAIHFDDYFYPYKIKGEEFPDHETFVNNNPTGYVNIDDWRRNNVDQIILMLSKKIKSIKPWVKFGISPFGVWRNNVDDPRGSKTTAGQTNYDNLYADILKWMENDWIDYVTPQLYWRIGHPAVDFYTLCDWWANNSFGKDVYIGHGLYRIDKNSPSESWKKSGEIEKQIEYLRNNPAIKGSAFYSSKHFKRNLFGLQSNLRNTIYHQACLPPIVTGIDIPIPNPPSINKKFGKKIKLKIAKNEEFTDKFVIYINKENEKPQILDITNQQKIKLKRYQLPKGKYELQATSANKNNVESSYSKSIKIKF